PLEGRQVQIPAALPFRARRNPEGAGEALGPPPVDAEVDEGGLDEGRDLLARIRGAGAVEEADRAVGDRIGFQALLPGAREPLVRRLADVVLELQAVLLEPFLLGKRPAQV